MRGLMMDRPLLVSSLIEHAGRIHASRPVVSRNTDGSVHRTTWGEVHRRCQRLAHGLADRGIREGDRVATLAWNNHRHLELYYGVSGIGAVLHTLNPRLHPDQLVYVLNHAEDRLLFVDTTFLPLVRAVAERLESVEAVVVLEGSEGMPEGEGLPDALAYEALLEGRPDRFEWPELDEHAAASLCYTSGTTGNPKGVLYSHRSTILHAWGVSVPGSLPAGEDETLLPVVPMFHANAWGAPYACAITGTALVLPGPGLDGASLTALMNETGVTFSSGVPTVWLGLVEHWRSSGERVRTLRCVGIGGSAPPPSMVRAFEEEFGIEVRHGWGMTEMSPLGSISVLTAEQREDPPEERVATLCRQGRPPFGVEIRVVDEEGDELPWDGESVGELMVRGPWVCSGYYREDESPGHRDGWFATGDVVAIHPDGCIRVTDRKKDLIKSGGEWISSIDLENLAMSHPDVAQAAVIGVPHEKWDERPVLFVVARPGAAPEPAGLLEFFDGKVAKWWIPDEVVFQEALPLGATGKVQKTRLREMWGERAAEG